MKDVMSFRIEKTQHDRLKFITRKQSAEQNKDITPADIIRELISKWIKTNEKVYKVQDK